MKQYIDFLILGKDSEQISTYFGKHMSYTTLPPQVSVNQLIQFDSNFESGNLDSAYLASLNEYNLLLKMDMNTVGNSLWFYFKAKS